MTIIKERRLTFTFPDSFKAVKYDKNGGFYQSFQKVLDTNNNDGICPVNYEECGANQNKSECHFKGKKKRCGANKVMGVSAVDILAADDSAAYLIEIKDLTNPRSSKEERREKLATLPDEMSKNVLFTLAALMPMRNNSSDIDELETAAKSLAAKKIRVILHLEFFEKDKKYLEPSNMKSGNILMQLRRRIAPIDNEAQIVSIDKMRGMGWKVEEQPWDEWELKSKRQNQ